MKTLFIPVKSKLKLDELIINDLSKKLPKNIAIAYSIQFKDIAFEKKNQKASYVRYLSAKNIGILVSTKPGQENLKQALDFKNNLKDKKGYLFIANNLNTNEFENFNIDSWVNTACPRMDLNNNKIINLKYVNELHKIL